MGSVNKGFFYYVWTIIILIFAVWFFILALHGFYNMLKFHVFNSGYALRLATSFVLGIFLGVVGYRKLIK